MAELTLLFQLILIWFQCKLTSSASFNPSRINSAPKETIPNPLSMYSPPTKGPISWSGKPIKYPPPSPKTLQIPYFTPTNPPIPMYKENYHPKSPNTPSHKTTPKSSRTCTHWNSSKTPMTHNHKPQLKPNSSSIPNWASTNTKANCKKSSNIFISSNKKTYNEKNNSGNTLTQTLPIKTRSRHLQYHWWRPTAQWWSPQWLWHLLPVPNPHRINQRTQVLQVTSRLSKNQFWRILWNRQTLGFWQKKPYLPHQKHET